MKPAEIKINLKDDYMILPFDQDTVIIQISESDFSLDMTTGTVEFKAKIKQL